MNYKITGALLIILLSVTGVRAQLPPSFGTSNEAIVSPMTKAYLPPQRIVWQSDSSGQYIKAVDQLLTNQGSQLTVSAAGLCQLIPGGDRPPGILLDYGKEIHGGIKIAMGIRTSKQPVKLRVRLGESVAEAMSSVGDPGNATNEHSLRDFVVEVPWLGTVEIGETGFRFVRLDLVEAQEEAVPLKYVQAAFIYRDLPYLGSFECSDAELNQIWETGAYTVHLNMQDYLWDGIKRDRLVWVGDMHPEVMTINSVFGHQDIVPKSLDFARDQHPLPAWMNGISSYSMWWVLIHRDWYNYHGDLTYLKEQESYMVNLLDQLRQCIDDGNRETLDGVRFLDWPTSELPQAVHAGLQALMVMTFRAGSDLMTILERPQLAEKYAATAHRLMQHSPQGNTTKQAAALMALAGLSDPGEVNREMLKVDGVERMSTFYGYYILEAMARAEDYAGAMEVIKNYWGGMLKLGATTFWEDFDILDATNSSRIDELVPAGMDDIHGDFGDYCYVGYRHSLCHGWASGPTAWLSQHVLGIQLSEAGERVTLTPHLGSLAWAKGSFPTKFGVLRVEHKKTSDGTIETSYQAPPGLRVVEP